MRNPTTCNTVVSNSDVGSFNLEQRLSRRYFFVIAGAALLAGCQSQQHTPAPRPTSTPLPAPQPITPQNAQHLVQVAELDAGGVAVRSVAWSPDGSILAVGAYPNVQLWDGKTGRRLATLKGHTGQVNGLAWTHDGSMLASASDDSTVRIWNPGQRATLKVLQPHPITSVALSVSWSPDGKQVAAGYADGMAIRWDVKTGQYLQLEKEISTDPRPFAVYGISWSPTGERIASNRYDSHVYLWDAGTGKKLATLAAYDKPNGITWSPDGGLLAVTDDSGAVEIWNGKTLKDQVNMLAHPEAGWCFGASWSPDGRMIAGARQGGLVQVWDAVTHKELAALTGHTRAAWTLAWSPDNLHIASGSDDATVRLWGVR
jgi:WD40 repeat protein